MPTTPVPLTGRLTGELDALLAITTFPEKLVAAFGLNLTASIQVALTAMAVVVVQVVDESLIK